MRHLIIIVCLVLFHTHSSAATQADVDSVFAWGETNFPELFAPPIQPSQTAFGYYYRYYPGSDSYLGFRDDDQTLYYLLPKGTVTAAGSINTYLTQSYTPPVNPDVLHKYLRAGVYRNWLAEAEPHQSSGPHGKVKTFFNPALVESLKANKDRHPLGATAIKELYAENNTLIGWAVEVKSAEVNADGRDWYWYEVDSVRAGSQATIAGNGVVMCTGCHSAGNDFVRARLP